MKLFELLGSSLLRPLCRMIVLAKLFKKNLRMKYSGENGVFDKGFTTKATKEKCSTDNNVSKIEKQDVASGTIFQHFSFDVFYAYSIFFVYRSTSN